jgi:hypothetical protein
VKNTLAILKYNLNLWKLNFFCSVRHKYIFWYRLALK